MLEDQLSTRTHGASLPGDKVTCLLTGNGVPEAETKVALWSLPRAFPLAQHHRRVTKVESSLQGTSAHTSDLTMLNSDLSLFLTHTSKSSDALGSKTAGKDEQSFVLPGEVNH